MIRLTHCFLVLGILLGTGCVANVFHSPTTLSTSSIAGRQAKLLKPIRAEAKNYFIVLVPIIADPRNIYHDLLEQSKAAGGNAVVDVQVRNKSIFVWALPPIVIDTWEAEGMAAVVGSSGGSGGSGASSR